MELTPGQVFLFQNLSVVSELTDTVNLCLYKPKCKLYITKVIKPEEVGYYEIISGIEHPNLAKVEFIANTGSEYRAVREFVAGDCLADIIESGKTFDERRAAKIIYDISSGLNALHEKSIVHRDVTPNNIIISNDGVPKIIDYGIARSFKEFKGKDTVIVGTPGYAAPEQFGFTQSNGRTDIYAIGVLLNVMICGKEPIEQLAEGRCRKIIKKCIQIDPRKRYANMLELMRAIRVSTGVGDDDALKGYSDSLLDRIISAIPGYRTRKLPFIILASIWYFIGGTSFVSVFSEQRTLGQYIGGTVANIFIIIVPLFCFHNFLDIYNKLPFSRGTSLGGQRILFYTLGVISLFVGFYIYGISIPAHT